MSPADAIPLTITDICASHARHAPDRIALVCEDQHVTYAELHARVSAAAMALSRHGVHSDVVGLFIDRSPDAIIGLLAILRAGGAYLPLDVNWPADRVTAICRVARLQLVLTASSAPALVWPTDVRALRLDALDSGSSANAPMCLAPVEPQHAALVIYTSGSTGEPKGVTVSHRAMAARLRRVSDASGGPYIQRASLSLIGHVGDLLAPLAAGGTLVMAPDSVLRHASGLAAWLRDQAARWIVLVPSQLRALLESDDMHLREWQRLDFVVVTGEPLPPTVAAAFISRFPNVQLLNGYGLTETVGLVAAATVESSDDITIGHGVAPSRLHLMDEVFNDVATGEVGELCVTGAQLASGYLHSPDLTAERFVPYALGVPGERCFRTGDMGRWTPHGVQLLGRSDDEVKVRGFRVNLIEVARVLEGHDSVVAAVAIWQPVGGTGQLHAWVTTPSRNFDAETLRRYAANHLASHMVPAAIHVVAELPYLPNGKIDRHALAATLDVLKETPAPLALSGTTARVASIWAEAFNVPVVDVNDDFFECGGDSLMVMTILAQIAAEFDVEITPDEFSNNSTVSALSDLIDHEATER